MPHALDSLFCSPDSMGLDVFFSGMDIAFEGVEITDPQGIIVYVNRSLEMQLGYEKDELIGTRSKILRSESFAPEVFEALWKTLREGKNWYGRFTNITKTGHTCEEEIRIIPFFDAQKNPKGYMVLTLDVSEKLGIQQQLKDLAQSKHEFVSLSSHQLRTPLTTINWYLEMILGGDAGVVPPEQAAFLQKVYESAQKMVGLVNQLLMISRLESGTIGPKIQPLDSKKIFDAIVKEVSLYAEKKKCPVRVERLDHFTEPLYTDESLFKTMIQNLILNSIKYSKETPVSVYLDEKDNQYLVRIEDQGIGIPQEFYTRLFAPFSRADNAHNKEGDGTGVGLYLVKLIVESLEGRIWFTSQIEKGTTFFISFPKKLLSVSTSVQ